jgi:transcriptional regulator GlxA family with amidase domain
MKLAGGETLEGTSGSVFILPANVAQYQETLGATRTTYIGFDAQGDIFDERARVLSLDPRDPALQWIAQLCDSRAARPPFSDEVAGTLLLALLRRLGEVDSAEGSLTLLHPAVRAARSVLEHRLSEPLTLREVARKAGASASHLSALFAAQYGVSPMQYLQRLRLDRARSLLSNPYLRIHEVAAACGYEDVNYFTRLFRSRFGIPPGRWRRK